MYKNTYNAISCSEEPSDEGQFTNICVTECTTQEVPSCDSLQHLPKFVLFAR